MKVICINAKGTSLPLIEGTLYEAVQSKEFTDSYTLVGVPSVVDPSDGFLVVAYRKHRFIPLSDIDETELAKQRE